MLGPELLRPTPACEQMTSRMFKSVERRPWMSSADMTWDAAGWGSAAVRMLA